MARIAIVAAVSVLAPLLAGCTLVQPGCRNRDVKASIEQDARESLDLEGSLSGLPLTANDTKVSLIDQIEVDRHDNTRSCTGHIAVGVGSNAVSVPIEYEVNAGADGQAFYQWDKDNFGKQLLGTAAMSALLEAARAKQHPQHDEETPQQPEAQPDAAIAPEAPAAARPWSQPATMPSNVMVAWKKEVRSEIAARAEKLTDMPEGKQHMHFRIGPDGEITMAQAIEPVGNPALADRLVKFLDGSELVTKPPLNRVTWIDVTFSF